MNAPAGWITEAGLLGRVEPERVAAGVPLARGSRLPLGRRSLGQQIIPLLNDYAEHAC